MKIRTKSVFRKHGLDGEEVARQHSPPLGPQELGSGRTDATRCRPKTGPAQDPPDGARPDPNPELAQLAFDPDATPPRVVSAETRDEVDGLGIDRRSARSSATVGPLAPHELAMPPKQRLRRDQERGPQIPRQGPARRREEHPVAVLELGATDRAPEHPHLVAEDASSSWSCDTLPRPVNAPSRRTITK
jgi:hypothetical protein